MNATTFVCFAIPASFICGLVFRKQVVPYLIDRKAHQVGVTRVDGNSPYLQDESLKKMFSGDYSDIE